jgi:hypothetical protein
MLLCALFMLTAQLMGLHFHRHAAVVHAGIDEGISLHLRDTGVHAHESLNDMSHHAPDDRASHPDVVEIDPLASGLAKFIKICMAPAMLLLAMLWLAALRPAAPAAIARSAARLHPSLFVLRPPSNAPPLRLSPVR